MSDKESSSTAATKLRLETAALIELVRQRPCLWNRADPLYRAKGEKERAWREVYRALQPAYADLPRDHRRDLGVMISRKWANIRDSYKKYLNGTSRATASRPYLYANLLTFLDATYNQEHKGRIYHDNKDSEEQDAEEQEWLNEVFVDMETRGSASPEAKRIKTEYSRVKDNTEPEESLVSVLVNLIEKEEDEDRAFFKSITPAVKSLSDGDKFLFRIRVMKLLDALKKKDNPSTKRETTARESDTE